MHPLEVGENFLLGSDCLARRRSGEPGDVGCRLREVWGVDGFRGNRTQTEALKNSAFVNHELGCSDIADQTSAIADLDSTCTFHVARDAARNLHFTRLNVSFHGGEGAHNQYVRCRYGSAKRTLQVQCARIADIAGNTSALTKVAIEFF